MKLLTRLDYTLNIKELYHRSKRVRSLDVKMVKIIWSYILMKRYLKLLDTINSGYKNIMGIEYLKVEMFMCNWY